ncbi:hypothetical protein A3Q56_05616, partial [Intoshia linei]
VERLHNLLLQTNNQVKQEDEKLKSVKNYLEKCQESLRLPLQINLENFLVVNSLKDYDLVCDDVFYQLKREFDYLNTAKEKLQDSIHKCFVKSCQLKEIINTISNNCQDKKVCLSIDTNQYHKNINSKDITLKVDPTAVIDGSNNPQEWFDFSIKIIDSANAIIKESIDLREYIIMNAHHFISCIKSIDVKTNYEFRKRMQQFKEAVDELTWKRNQCLIELNKQKCANEFLEKTINEKRNYRKLVHTRLENRKFRPNRELCRDDAQYSLNDELVVLESAVEKLLDEFSKSQYVFNIFDTLNVDIEDILGYKATQCLFSQVNVIKMLQKLNTLHQRIEKEIACKNDSILKYDLCMNSRKKLDIFDVVPLIN